MNVLNSQNQSNCYVQVRNRKTANMNQEASLMIAERNPDDLSNYVNNSIQR